MKKKLFSLFLILGLIACLTFSASAEEVGGSFDSFTWTYNTDTATLTVGGEGHMGSLQFKDIPWEDYTTQIRSIVIEPGVTAVGDHAFTGCTSVTSVTLPEGLTAIENFCFNGCTALNQIKLPSTLEYIDDSAFRGTGLTGITFPASLKHIYRAAFYDCKSLISVTIPGNVETIDDSAFEKCTALLKLTIEEGVKTIDLSAFRDCSSLLEVTIPGSVTEWGMDSFLSCENLRSVTVAEGVTSIPTEAFMHCDNLVSITLPSTLRTINSRAFSSCDKLDSVVIPEGVTTLATSVFSGCTGLTSVSLPGTLTSMGSDCFSDCESLTHVTIPGSLSVVPNRTFESCGNLQSVTIEEGVTTLGHSLFRHCAKLKELEIPSSVTTIEGEMCYSCTSLKKVVFQPGTVSIGGLAFQNCTALEEVVLPSTLQTIGSGAFEYCSSLKTLTVPGSVTSIGNRAFGRTGIRSLKVESGMLQLSAWSLSEMDKLIYVVLPETMVLVNENACNGCDLLCHALITGPETEIISNKGNDTYDASVKHFNAKGDEITIQEDCTSVYAYCSICDEAIYSETKKNAEHSFGDWVLTTPPTTTKAGEETRTCSVCDTEETRTVAKLPAQKNPFTDVPEGSYYEAPVIWAVDEGITNGITPTTFEPMTISTRGQVVTFLWRCAGCPEPKTKLNPFDDVAEGKFYYDAVLWAVENGITNGTSDTTFSPMVDCTRGHVVTFLHRYLGTPEPESANNPFTDVAQDRYFYDAVLWAVENGITNGTSANTFSPDNKCKRCEIVTFLYRALYNN